MTSPANPILSVAIACGGTGGHLFPGLAVAERLVQRGSRVTVLVSPKDVDQNAVKMTSGMQIVTLPAIGLTPGRRIAFARAFWQSYRASRRLFEVNPPHAVLAMGGFTGAPPILAGKRLGARTFLHESNTVTGRANQWLAWFVDDAFVGFPSAARRLRHCRLTVTGTPVRPQFQPRDAGLCRRALGLEPERPVMIVMGGSQGAHGVNELVMNSLPLFARIAPDWQWLHLTGSTDVEPVKSAYAAAKLRAMVHPFLAEMELVLSAATVAVSRAGASSLAELAAVRVPAVLVPYPAATDNHQYHNARAFEETGAALLLEQSAATLETLVRLVGPLMQNAATRQNMQAALARWHTPHAADQIAESMLGTLSTAVRSRTSRDPGPNSRRDPPFENPVRVATGPAPGGLVRT